MEQEKCDIQAALEEAEVHITRLLGDENQRQTLVKTLKVDSDSVKYISYHQAGEKLNLYSFIKGIRQ